MTIDAATPAADLPAWLTRAEAAEWLRIGLDALDGAISRGEIGSVKLGEDGTTATVRIPRDALLARLGLATRSTRPKRRRAAGDEVAVARLRLKGVTV